MFDKNPSYGLELLLSILIRFQVRAQMRMTRLLMALFGLTFWGPSQILSSQCLPNYDQGRHFQIKPSLVILDHSSPSKSPNSQQT